MANQKISEMQRIQSIRPADMLYAVQDGISSNITAGDLFGKLPDVLLGGSFQLDTVESIVANGGLISDNHVVTALSVDNIDRVFELSTGTPTEPLANFMFKIVYVKTQFTGKAIIRGGLINDIDNVTLEKNGDVAIFMSTPLGWIYVAGAGIVTRV